MILLVTTLKIIDIINVLRCVALKATDRKAFNTSQHINTFFRPIYRGLCYFKNSISKGYIGESIKAY